MPKKATSGKSIRVTLPLDDGLKVRSRQVQRSAERFVEQHLRLLTIHDCPDSQFRLVRRADLPDANHFEWRAEGTRDFVADRNPAARQGEYDGIASAVLEQFHGEPLARMGSIPEHAAPFALRCNSLQDSPGRATCSRRATRTDRHWASASRPDSTLHPERILK